MMASDSSSSPFLPFRATEEREYGAIRLFDDTSETTAGLPFKYSCFVVSPGSISRRDQHEVQEVWVILSGSGNLLVDGSLFRVKPGDVVHFDSMRTHQVENDGAGDIEVFSFWWNRDGA